MSKCARAITASWSGFGSPLRFVLPCAASVNIVSISDSNWSAGLTSHWKRASLLAGVPEAVRRAGRDDGDLAGPCLESPCRRREGRGGPRAPRSAPSGRGARARRRRSRAGARSPRPAPTPLRSPRRCGGRPAPHRSRGSRACLLGGIMFEPPWFVARSVAGTGEPDGSAYRVARLLRSGNDPFGAFTRGCLLGCALSSPVGWTSRPPCGGSPRPSGGARRAEPSLAGRIASTRSA